MNKQESFLNVEGRARSREVRRGQGRRCLPLRIEITKSSQYCRNTARKRAVISLYRVLFERTNSGCRGPRSSLLNSSRCASFAYSASVRCAHCWPEFHRRDVKHAEASQRKNVFPRDSLPGLVVQRSILV